MIPALPDPANDDFRPSERDAVAKHFATRGLRRGLTAAASCLAAAVLTFTMLHGMQSGGALPDAILSLRF